MPQNPACEYPEQRCLLDVVAGFTGDAEIIVQDRRPVRVDIGQGMVPLNGKQDLLDYLDGLVWGRARVRFEVGAPVMVLSSEKQTKLGER